MGRFKFIKTQGRRVFILAVSCLLLFPGMPAAQELGEGAAMKARASSHFRTWAVLGDLSTKETYSLVCETGKGDEDRQVVFSGIRGCYRGGYGAGYQEVPAGKACFRLLRDGSPNGELDRIEEDLEKDAAYTVLAIFQNGIPRLQLIRESPTAPELDGVYIYNLLPEATLKVAAGKGAANQVPEFGGQPLVIPAAQISGGTLTFLYASRQHPEARQEVSYPGHGRLSVVFMRNNYSNPNIFVCPSEPNHRTPSDE